jgi:hypothetical protein
MVLLLLLLLAGLLVPLLLLLLFRMMMVTKKRGARMSAPTLRELQEVLWLRTNKRRGGGRGGHWGVEKIIRGGRRKWGRVNE